MTPHKNTHNNNHKNRAITAVFNRFAFICLLASGAVLTACIGGESAESRHDFSSRTFVLDGNLSSQAATASGAGLSDVAYRYLTSIGFQGFERQGTIIGNKRQGNFDGNTDRLDAEDGFLLIETKGEGGDGGHVFAGRFDTTDVGDELTEAPPVAIFSGQATMVLVHAEGGGLFGGNTSVRSKMDFSNLALTVNFDDKTLKGSDSNGFGRLTVDGRFSGKRLLGNVTATFNDTAIIKAASRSNFTADLDGLIGEDGAVGVFNNHLARGRPSDYAFAGGFVVKPPPATNP
ncbi:MAG: hypothetical protein K8953_11345 [Proteobacteria bacterium]|nr:hypothetical protein [Pseudomonadota bacterium]